MTDTIAPDRPLRVLVTGVGGAAGIAVLRALRGDAYELVAGDCDPLATGLHLVPPARRVVLPRGNDPTFASEVLELSTRLGIDVLVPTVDEELVPLARAAAAFDDAGVVVVSPSLEALRTCLDKHALLEAVGNVVPCPRTALLDGRFADLDWAYPLVVKPRMGRGGRGVEVVGAPGALARLPRDGRLLVQELLPGEEYSVDVLVTRAGHVVAAVPRVRLRVDSGVAVVTRTLHDPELERAAGVCAVAAGIRGPANVQFRRDLAGVPRLLEINPRFPGTLAVTIASGVDLPALAIRDALGLPLPQGAGAFTPVGMVRMLEDVVVPAGELDPPGLRATTSAADTVLIA